MGMREISKTIAWEKEMGLYYLNKPEGGRDRDNLVHSYTNYIREETAPFLLYDG